MLRLKTCTKPRTDEITAAGAITLSYDYESRVTGITYLNSSTDSFTYNGLHTRVGKTGSSGTATYRRDGALLCRSFGALGVWGCGGGFGSRRETLRRA